MRNIVAIITIIIDVILGVIVLHALSFCTSVFKLVFAQEQTRLEALTDQGTFKVQILWTSNEVGNPNDFELRFFDPDTGDEIEDIKYDISIYREDKLKVQRLNQTSIFQEFSFEDLGAYEIRIEDVEDLGERATIPIRVTAEFGVDVFMLSAAAIGIGLLAAWRNNNSLFRRAMN